MTSTPVTRRVNQEGPDQQDFRMRAFRNVPVLLQKACVGAPTLMGLVARLASPRTTRAGTNGLRDSPLVGGGFEPVWGLYGAFPVKWSFGLLAVFSSERESRSSSPSPAIRFAERAEGVKGPKR